MKNLSLTDVLWGVTTIAFYGWGLVWAVRNAVRNFKSR